MKRRDFILKSGFFVIFGTALGGKLIQNAYALTWAAAGKLGYKEVAPSSMISAGKKCSTCSWYILDPKIPSSGLCKFVGIQKANGGGEVHVKGDGYCTMWKKKA